MLSCSHHELSAKQKHRRYELNRLPYHHAPLGAIHGEANSRATHNSWRKPIHWKCPQALSCGRNDRIRFFALDGLRSARLWQPFRLSFTPERSNPCIIKSIKKKHPKGAFFMATNAFFDTGCVGLQKVAFVQPFFEECNPMQKQCNPAFLPFAKLFKKVCSQHF